MGYFWILDIPEEILSIRFRRSAILFGFSLYFMKIFVYAHFLIFTKDFILEYLVLYSIIYLVIFALINFALFLRHRKTENRITPQISSISQEKQNFLDFSTHLQFINKITSFQLWIRIIVTSHSSSFHFTLLLYYFSLIPDSSIHILVFCIIGFAMPISLINVSVLELNLTINLILDRDIRNNYFNDGQFYIYQLNIYVFQGFIWAGLCFISVLIGSICGTTQNDIASIVFLVFLSLLIMIWLGAKIFIYCKEWFFSKKEQ